MPDFWTYITQGAYSIGCTGQTVYVYKDGQELCQLKGFRYTYMACFSPDGKYFALKSGEGLLYLYTLEDLTLVKKVRLGKREDPQDGMFTFTAQGDAIVSIDSSHGGVRTMLRFYSVPELAVTQVLFDDNPQEFIMSIEQGAEPEAFYVLRGERPIDGDQAIIYSLSLLRHGVVEKQLSVTETEAEFYRGFLHLKSCGFTPKAKKWSPLRYGGYNLTKIDNCQHTLAKLFSYYESKGQE